MANDSTSAASTTPATATQSTRTSRIMDVTINQASGTETDYPFGMPRTTFAPLSSNPSTSNTRPITEPFGSTASSGANQNSTGTQPDGMVGALGAQEAPLEGCETPRTRIPPPSQEESLNELSGILRILTDQQKHINSKFANLEAHLQSRPTINPRDSVRRNLLGDMENVETIGTETPGSPQHSLEILADNEPENPNHDAAARDALNNGPSVEGPQPDQANGSRRARETAGRFNKASDSSTFAARARPEAKDPVIEELRQQLQAVISRVHRNESAAPEIDRVIREAQNTPFTSTITHQHLRDTSKVKIPRFEGNADPGVHLSAFHIAILKARFLPHEKEAGYCRLFAENLGGEALRWFSRLPPNSINSFGQLESAFATHYAAYVKRDVSARDLWNTVQAPGETLRSYIDRYRDAASRSYMPDMITIPGLQNGLRRGSEFKWDIDINEPKTLEDALFRAQVFIRIEETEAAAAGVDKDEASPPAPPSAREDPRAAKKGTGANVRDRRARAYSVTEAPPEKDAKPETPPTKKFRENDHDDNAYCDFHRRNGHSTEECRHLTNKLIEEFRRGKINLPAPRARSDKTQNTRVNQVTAKEVRAKPPPNDEDPTIHPKNDPAGAIEEETLPQPPRARINMIMGGLMDCNDSVRSIKASERKAQAAKRSLPTTQDEVAPRKDVITFSNADLTGVDLPHNDPLVISMTIAEYDVARILVDTGSSVNLIFKSTLDKMELEGYYLKPEFRPLTGFNGESTTTIGTISLPVGDRPGSRMVDFQIIDKPTIYNAILGTPWLFAIRGVASTYHQCVKYPTKWGIATIRGNQADARVCFVHEKKLRNKSLRCNMIVGIDNMEDPLYDHEYFEDQRDYWSRTIQAEIDNSIQTLSRRFAKMKIAPPRMAKIKKARSIRHSAPYEVTEPARRFKRRRPIPYCHFHKRHGHLTIECRAKNRAESSSSDPPVYENHYHRATSSPPC